MATHDYVLDNASGANFRSDLNNALAAIVSNNSSSSEPSTKYAYQWWADTNEGVLKIRNSANDGWVTLLQLDGTLTLEDGSQTAPALGFRDDLNTGIFSSAADTLDITCGGTTRGSFSSSGLTVTGNVTATTFVGDVDANNGDFDGTLEADAITVGGTALNTVIAGVASTNVTVADESSDTTCFPLFVTAATGDLAPKSGSNLTFNSSNGTLTATAFSGDGSGLSGVGGTTINSNAANRVVTGSGTANTLTANSDLLWNGSRLDIDTGGTEDALRIGNSAGTDTFIRLGAIGTAVDTHAVIKYDKDENYLSMLISGESHGNSGIYIEDGGKVRIPAGAKIGGTTDANLLDDFEEGTWTPQLINQSTSQFATATGKYTKVGNMVRLSVFFFSSGSANGQNMLYIQNLPFGFPSEPNSVGTIVRYSGGNHQNINHSEPVYIAQGGSQIRFDGGFDVGTNKNLTLTLVASTD